MIFSVKRFSLERKLEFVFWMERDEIQGAFEWSSLDKRKQFLIPEEEAIEK